MITHRLGMFQQDPDRVKEFIEAVKRQKGSCDTVWLLVQSHYPSLEYHKIVAKKWIPAINQFRQAGIKISIQNVNTLGHMDWALSKDNPFLEGMMGADGKIYDPYVEPTGEKNITCFCWRGERFKAYIKETLKIYAKIVQPDRFWIDDDLRPHHHSPNEYGCFCDTCISAFNKSYGTNFNRDELVSAINYGDTVWRERFAQFTRKGLYDFTYEISKAILEVSPQTSFGMEYGPFGYYTGKDENYFLDAFRDAGAKTVGVRPGGGYYNDKAPYDQYKKMFDISLMVASFPDFADSVEAEIENLPGVAFGKSIGRIINEATLDLAIGCTGLTFTDVQSMHEPMDYYEKIFAAVSKARSYFEKLSDISKNCYRCGTAVYQSEKPHMLPLKAGDKPFSWAEPPKEEDINLFRLGIPISFDKRAASSYILHNSAVDAMTDEEIEFLLAKPVLTDGEAVKKIIERGYGKYFSMKPIHIVDNTAFEYFTDNAINPAGSGSFFRENPYASKIMNRYIFENIDEKTTVLGNMHRSPILDDGGYIGPCTVITELCRADGISVKWAIFGYSVWNDIVSAAKRNEIYGALDYISPLPVRLVSDEIAALIPSTDKDGRVVSATVASASQNGTAELELKVRGAKGKKATIMGVSGYKDTADIAKTKEGEFTVKIPALMPYEIVTVFFEE